MRWNLFTFDLRRSALSALGVAASGVPTKTTSSSSSVAVFELANGPGTSAAISLRLLARLLPDLETPSTLAALEDMASISSGGGADYAVGHVNGVAA